MLSLGMYCARLMGSALAAVGGFDSDITYGEAFDSLLKNINHKYSIVCSLVEITFHVFVMNFQKTYLLPNSYKVRLYQFSHI